MIKCKFCQSKTLTLVANASAGNIHRSALSKQPCASYYSGNLRPGSIFSCACAHTHRDWVCTLHAILRFAYNHMTYMIRFSRVLAVVYYFCFVAHSQRLVNLYWQWNCRNLCKVTAVYSGELRHETCPFYTRYTSISKINSECGNLKDQMKLDLCIYEALSYMYSAMETVFVGVAINYH